MENKCNKLNITGFFLMDKRLDLSSKVNIDIKEKINEIIKTIG